MRISDWSSDVCSSDLHRPHPSAALGARRQGLASAAYGSIASASIIAIPVVDGQQKSLHQAGPFVVSIERTRSEEHTSELQSLMRISYAVFCLKKKTYHMQYIQHVINSTKQTKIQHDPKVLVYNTEHNHRQ